MAGKNYERILLEIFGHEGAYGADPHDRGNWTSGVIGQGALNGTKFGISAAAYPTLDIRSLTVTDAARIYRQDYWNAINGDSLYTGVDLSVMDDAVNSGASHAKKIYAASWRSDRIEIIDDFNNRRLSFLHHLKSWSRYGKGWARRVANVHATSLAWAWTEMGWTRDQIAKALRDRALDHSTKASTDHKAGSSAAGSGTVAGGAMALHHWSTADKVAMAMIVIAFLVLTVFLIRRARKHTILASALAAKAGELA